MAAGVALKSQSAGVAASDAELRGRWFPTRTPQPMIGVIRNRTL